MIVNREVKICLFLLFCLEKIEIPVFLCTLSNRQSLGQNLNKKKTKKLKENQDHSEGTDMKLLSNNLSVNLENPAKGREAGKKGWRSTN